MRPALLCVLLAGCQVQPPPAAVRIEEDVGTVLADVRRAVGTAALLELDDGLTLTGKRVRGGAERPLSVSLRATGGFMISAGADDDVAARGFDGKDAWTRSAAGITRTLALGAREEQVLDGWLRTQVWLLPAARRLLVSIDEPGSRSDTIRLLIEPPGEPLRATVDLDRTSMRPRSYSMETSGRTRTVTFDDWRTEAGVTVPYAITEEVDGEVRSADRFERAVLDTPPSFAEPRGRAGDVEFAPGTTSLPARLDAGGRFYVGARIDGGDEVWMLLDTGFGAQGVDGGLADALGLDAGGSARLSGVGGAGTSRWRRAATLDVGGFRQLAPSFATVDGAHLSERAGFPVRGVLGLPLFERALVVLDPGARTVTLAPAGRAVGLRGDARWAGLAMDGAAVCLRGAIAGPGVAPGEGNDCWLRLDTGSDDVLTLAPWADTRFELSRRARGARAARLTGLFGELRVVRFRAAALEFAGVRLDEPTLTAIRSPASGPLADPWIAGNLGMGALGGRRLVLDVGRGRLALD